MPVEKRTEPFNKNEFAIEVSYSWTKHWAGDETRLTKGQYDEDQSERREAIELARILSEFHDVATQHSPECKRTASSRRNENKHFFDLGFDVIHFEQVAAYCVSLKLLGVLIKSTKDVLVKWLEKRSGGIDVKLGNGKRVAVRNAIELEKVIQALDKSEFAKARPKQSGELKVPAENAARKKTSSNKNAKPKENSPL